MRTSPRLIILGLILATTLSAQERFTDRLTTEERAAAGLNQLTPAQIDKLNELVQRDRSAAAAQSTAAMTAPTTALTEVAPAVTDRPPTAERTAAPAPAKHRMFGLPVHDDTNAITGVIDGEFRGWNGNTMFRLKDGEIWIQEDKTDHHETGPIQNPRVKIAKSMFGGYKMTIEGVAGWVRVRRVQ